MDCIEQAHGENWSMFRGDCCQLIEGLPDESVGFSVFSPPFSSLYSYSDSPHDMGNCLNYQDFFDQFKFLVRGLYRVLMPGRLISVHCMNLPTTKQHHGEIGIQDFRGDLIRAFVDDEAADLHAAVSRIRDRIGVATAAGDFERAANLGGIEAALLRELQEHESEKKFVFHSEVCIWKDPVTAMQRTKALGLLHKQVLKDSCMSRQGVPDYVVTFRKPGVNPVPVSGPFDRWVGDDSFENTGNKSIDIWQRFASPVWMDIRPNRTLQYTTARDEKDERHLCVASGSLVLTERGYVPIQDVSVGESVLTHKGRWRRVLAKRCNGIQETVKLKAHGVPGLCVTPDHKIWTRLGVGKQGSRFHPRKAAMSNSPGWVEAKDTLASYVNLPLPPVEESTFTELEWWIAGRWLADGHWDSCQRPGLHISCGSHKYEETIQRLGKHAGTEQSHGTCVQIRLRDGDGRLRELVSKLGRGAKGKTVPKEAMCLNEELSRAFLDGYLSGDGHFVERYSRMTASSASRSLLLGLAVVYQRVHGKVASVYLGKPAHAGVIQGRSVNCNDEWVFSASRKNGSAFIADDGAWKKVRSITESGLQEVWDIQVEEDESFIAEGCAVHNCPLQLDVIERCMELWSQPGDTVLTPFGGIGSELHVAITTGRKAIGFELKDTYFAKAVENCRLAEQSTQVGQKRLFGE